MVTMYGIERRRRYAPNEAIQARLLSLQNKLLKCTLRIKRMREDQIFSDIQCYR